MRGMTLGWGLFVLTLVGCGEGASRGARLSFDPSALNSVEACEAENARSLQRMATALRAVDDREGALAALPQLDLIRRELMAVALQANRFSESAVEQPPSPAQMAATLAVQAQGQRLILLPAVVEVLRDPVESMVGFAVFLGANRALQQKAKRDLLALVDAVRFFLVREDRLPDAEEWPAFLTEGSPNYPHAYIEFEARDPWGGAYVYRRFGEVDFQVLSLGADRAAGGRGKNADLRLSP